MTQLQLDQINHDELYLLKKAIDSYFSIHDAAERVFCEGSGEYEELQDEVLLKAHQLKERLRSVVSDFGIHGDILNEYAASCNRNGLQLSVATEF